MSNTTEVDRIIASQLRETYRTTQDVLIESSAPFGLPLVSMFLTHALSVDDHALCELESTRSKGNVMSKSPSQEFANEPWNYVARMYQEAKRLFGEGSLIAQVCYRQHCAWAYGI